MCTIIKKLSRRLNSDGTPPLNLEINILHITYTGTFYPCLFHFCIFLSRSATNKRNTNGTRTVFELHYITQFMDNLGLLNLHLEVRELFFLTFWTLLIRNKHIPYTFHYYCLSISISFSYFLSRSAGNKGSMNAQLQDVTNLMDFRVFGSALGR